MPNVHCSFPNCEYETGELTAELALELLRLHKPAHDAATANSNAERTTKQKAPKIDRPKISDGSSEETWNAFSARWSMFTRGTHLTPDEKVQQLFQCCDDHLGDAILRGQPEAVNGDEATLLRVIKTFAVVPVARVVRRTEVLALKQDHGESTRNFLARIKGKIYR